MFYIILLCLLFVIVFVVKMRDKRGDTVCKLCIILVKPWFQVIYYSAYVPWHASCKSHVSTSLYPYVRGPSVIQL